MRSSQRDLAACNSAGKQLTRSPVTRIPPETLAYVFECCVGCFAAEFKAHRDGVHVHPLPRITQVCRFWRAVAESDPHLWTSIHLSFPAPHQNREEDVPNVKRVFDQYLKRSGNLPISFTFTDHRMYDVATENLISLLVEQLRGHAPRWKHITLEMCHGYFPILFTFTPCDLSSLESIHISGDAFPLDCALLLDLESAAKLASFTYNGPGPETRETIHIRWENLSAVAFEFAYIAPSRTLPRQLGYLSQCKNVTTCFLGINQTLPVDANHFVTLSSLQTLRVRRLSADAYVAGAIAPLILPQLQTLEIDAAHLVNRNKFWHRGDFSDLLARSGCHLLHLSIQDVDFPNDELLRCLALSPALVSLRFIPSPRSQNIYNVMCEMDVSHTPTLAYLLFRNHGPSVRAGPLVPQLREITLASSAERHLDEMLNMFRSRTDPRVRAADVVPLQRIEVVFFDLWHDMDGVYVRGSREKRVARFQAKLAQWMSQNGREDVDVEGLEASVRVDSPYLPEYVEVEY